MKSVKLNQLLFGATGPCLSIYAPDLAGLAGLHERIVQRLQAWPELLEIYQHELPAMQKVMQRWSDYPHGFFLSPQRRGYLQLDHETHPQFVTGQSFSLRPVLEELFTNPEYTLVVIAADELRLYRGDSKVVELLERFEVGRSFSLATTSVLSHMVTTVQRKAVREMAMRIHQLPRLARLPVVIAGPGELVQLFCRSFSHSDGVIPLEVTHLAELTCPELVQQLPLFREPLLEIYAENFKLRLKNLVRSRRIVSDLQGLIRAIVEGQVQRLLMPQKRRLFGRLDLTTFGCDILGLHPVEGADDVLEELASLVIQHGGRIQLLPDHFFPHGSFAMGILRGESVAHSSLSGLASHAR